MNGKTFLLKSAVMKIQVTLIFSIVQVMFLNCAFGLLIEGKHWPELIPMTALGVILMDKTGRRPLLLISASGTCSGCFLVSLSFFLQLSAVGTCLRCFLAALSFILCRTYINGRKSDLFPQVVFLSLIRIKSYFTKRIRLNGRSLKALGEDEDRRTIYDRGIDIIFKC